MTPYFSFALFVGSLSGDGKLVLFNSLLLAYLQFLCIEEKSFQDFHKQAIGLQIRQGIDWDWSFWQFPVMFLLPRFSYSLTCH